MPTRKEWLEGFAQCERKTGDMLIVYASYCYLGGMEGSADEVVGAICEAVGSTSTVLFPAFNFGSWRRTHYFDLLETPSTMGMICEAARRRPDAKRTRHPIYSFSVFGDRASEFAATDDPDEFGPQSPFAMFHRGNGTVVCIDTDFNKAFALQHYVEHNVGCEYRRVQPFSGIYVGHDRRPRMKTYSMFSRRHERIRTCVAQGMSELLATGVIKETSIGSVKLRFAAVAEFYDNMSALVREHPEMLHAVRRPVF